MLVTGCVAVGVILFARVRHPENSESAVGWRRISGWLVEGLYGFLESISDRDCERRHSGFSRRFHFILARMVRLIPVPHDGWGLKVNTVLKWTRPLLRAGNADLNMTFAMAMIFFAC